MKIQCSCGAKYAFDLTPEMAREPVKFVCPQCGADSSAVVNQLIRQEFAAENLPPAPPQPAETVTIKPAATKLKISHSEKPAEAPATEYAPENSKYCQKHRGVLTTENCTVCKKPICPQCLDLFGYFCSPLCKNKAEMQGIGAPVHAGGRFAAEAKFWRKTGLIFGTLCVAVVLFFGVWIWYAWFGSVPHTYFSVRFADNDRAYAGGVQLVGPDDLVFLHGGTLARYNLKTKAKIWSQELIAPDQINVLVKQADDARAAVNAQMSGGEYARIPPAGAEAREAKIELQNALTLSVDGKNIWVAANGKVTQYDWDTGKTVHEMTTEEVVRTGKISTGGGLFSRDGQPLDPDKVAAQAQNLNLPARIALPALLGNDLYEQQIEAALKDGDTQPPQRKNSKANPRTEENFRLIAGDNGFVRFGVKLLQQNIVTREAMRAAPEKSALDDPNLTGAQTTAVANEMLNEMQRNKGGDTVSENDSRYAVTVHIPNSPDIKDWTGEVTGPPQLFCLKTVNVIAANKTVIVLDKSNKQLWTATLTYNVSGGGESAYGAGPAVERNGTLYVFDQAVLSAFDVATGNARWRLPSVGIVGLFFDDAGNLYVNTTTGNPDDIKYSRQIDIEKSTAAVLQKIDPATGKILWSVKPGGFVSYLSGKFIYAVQSFDPNPTDEEELTTATEGLEKPPFLRIVRIDPKDGRTLWDYEQDRCPVSVQFDQNIIELVFKREVQVLKYLTL